MTHVENLVFVMEKLEMKASMLAAILRVTEKGLTEGALKATIRLERMVQFLQMAIKAGITSSGELNNMQDVALNMLTSDEDCYTCAGYAVTEDEMSDADRTFRFQVGVEMWSKEMEAYDAGVKLKERENLLKKLFAAFEGWTFEEDEDLYGPVNELRNLFLKELK